MVLISWGRLKAKEIHATQRALFNFYFC